MLGEELIAAGGSVRLPNWMTPIWTVGFCPPIRLVLRRSGSMPGIDCLPRVPVNSTEMGWSGSGPPVARTLPAPMGVSVSRALWTSAAVASNGIGSVVSVRRAPVPLPPAK